MFLNYLLATFTFFLKLLQTKTFYISSVYSIQSHQLNLLTANFLTLNSSKTEFLLIGLSKQLAKIHNSSLNTTHSA